MATTQAPLPNGGKKNEVIGHMPIIETPYTRMTEHWFTWQDGPCANHEMDFSQCAGRVGVLNAEKACKKYHDDFVECAYRVKTQKRYNIMQAERKKQSRPFPETPAPDSINTWKK